MVHGKLVMVRGALIAAAAYAVCVLYDLAAPVPHGLRSWMVVVLPGFRALSLPGFLIGLAESVVFGVVVAALTIGVADAVRRLRGPRAGLGRRRRTMQR